MEDEKSFVKLAFFPFLSQLHGRFFFWTNYPMAQFNTDTLAMQSADTICHAMEKPFLRALALRVLPPGSGCLITLTAGKSLAGRAGLKK